MADDKAKKTKIDLKARLGKSSTLTGMSSPGPMPMPVPGGAPMPGMIPDSNPGAGSVPPPPGGPSGTPVPAPKPSARPASIAPPPGISAGMSPGIPLPPFAPQSRPQQAAAPKPTAAQQTIKVEIGEEIEQERKKARRNAGIAALLGAAVGLFIGFVAGGSSEKGGRLKDAAGGAGRLEKEIVAANDKMKELNDKLEDAQAKIAAKAFPDDLAAALGAINIPFDATNLDGKYAGSLSSKVLRNILAYTSAVETMNSNKDKLKSNCTSAQAPLAKSFKEEKEPMANFAVIFAGAGDKKTVAELWTIKDKESFSWKGEFPATFTVSKKEGDKVTDKKVTRWVKGDLTGSEAIGIPVDSHSPTQMGVNEYARNFLRLLFEMREALQGNHDDPSHEKAGLLKDGEDLANELHKVSLAQ